MNYAKISKSFNLSAYDEMISFAHKKAFVNILIGINNFFVGGAENYAIRFAQALLRAGHRVHLFALHDWLPEEIRKRLKAVLADDFENIPFVTRWTPSGFTDFILWNFQGLFSKFGKKDFRERYIERKQLAKLKSYIKEEKIEILNTQLFETDEYFSVNFSLPHVISMHGSYEANLKSSDEKNTSTISGKMFLQRAERILKKSGYIIYCADKNIEVLNYFKSNTIKTKKIYYGYPFVQTKKCEQLPDSGEEFVFGMVARGIESKGWEIAIRSFIEITSSTEKHLKLLLIYTSSPYMDILKERYGNYKNIVFVGFHEDPVQFMPCFSATLLPTFDDCFPITIIESIISGVPVISTDVGEIPQMINRDGAEAGAIVPRMVGGEPSVEEYTKEMKKFVCDTEYYSNLKENCKVVMENFNMDRCVAEHIDFFRRSIESKA